MSALTMSGVTTLTTAISLANFNPRIENLPSQCQSIYTTPIEGCKAEDFTTAGATCSNECVTGLVKIMKKVEVACASVDVPETSIIGIFLLGRGIPTLCPGIEVITISPSSARPIATPTPTPTSSEEEATTTTEAEATSTEEPETTTETAAVTSTEAPSDTGTATNVQTTFETSTPTPESSATSSAAGPTATGNRQLSNADSGGGSPFDVQAIGAAAPSKSFRKLAFSAILGVVGLAFTIV